MDYGKPATCTQLSVKYGEAKNYYVTAAVNLAKRIQSIVHCSLCDEKWWPILFIGQEAAKEDQGSYRWKLRDELKEALIDFDFGTTPLYASEKAPDNSTSCKDELVSLAFIYEEYSDDSFLNEVYIDEAELQTMKSLLRRKKNLILQGAPGTGKTFAAKRLAYTMMGLKDTSRIQLVQFHQSSTYEDFIYGYRPNGEGGFEPQPGVFMRFCQRASKDLDNEYFFIIDEINRANISKVFGELLMLIEADHRGESVELGIDGQRFSVPPNLYLIGMMNTAGRGLALIDYALRRRFAFYEMKPALDNPTFLSMVADTKNERLTSLINCVRNLNLEIAKDPALGRGFCIGHSYFCANDDGVVSDENVFEIVEYELKPLLEEYWFDEPDKVEAEMDKIEKAIRS